MKAKRFIMENTDMLKNYIGGYMELPPETAASLKPGEGRILQVDGQRVGAYKDTDGTIYTVKPGMHPHGLHIGMEPGRVLLGLSLSRLPLRRYREDPQQSRPGALGGKPRWERNKGNKFQGETRITTQDFPAK